MNSYGNKNYLNIIWVFWVHEVQDTQQEIRGFQGDEDSS
jgi:hypothetical protein